MLDPNILVLAKAMAKGNGEVAWREIANATETSVLSSTYGAYCFGVLWDTMMAFESTPKTFSITYDGVTYENLRATNINGIGYAVGNLSFANAMLGTSFENTGEPFAAAISKFNLYFMTLDTEETEHTVKVRAYCKPLSTLPFIDLTKYVPSITEKYHKVDVLADEDYYTLKQNDAVMLKVCIGSKARIIVVHPNRDEYNDDIAHIVSVSGVGATVFRMQTALGNDCFCAEVGVFSIEVS